MKQLHRKTSSNENGDNSANLSSTLKVTRQNSGSKVRPSSSFGGNQGGATPRGASTFQKKDQASGQGARPLQKTLSKMFRDQYMETFDIGRGKAPLLRKTTTQMEIDEAFDESSQKSFNFGAAVDLYNKNGG